MYFQQVNLKQTIIVLAWLHPTSDVCIPTEEATGARAQGPSTPGSCGITEVDWRCVARSHHTIISKLIKH